MVKDREVRSADRMTLRILMLMLLLSAPFGSHAQSSSAATSSAGNAHLIGLWPKSDTFKSQGRDAETYNYFDAGAAATSAGILEFGLIETNPLPN